MKFKVGDRVYQRINSQYGVITKIDKGFNYPYTFQTYCGDVYDTADEYIELSEGKEKSSPTIKMRNPIHSIDLDSIRETVIFKDDIIKIGCQSLSLDDAKAFVDKFNELYEAL